jgi:hypothetical protein
MSIHQEPLVGMMHAVDALLNEAVGSWVVGQLESGGSSS